MCPFFFFGNNCKTTQIKFVCRGGAKNPGIIYYIKVFIAVTRVFPHLPRYLYVCTCGRSGVGRLFMAVLVFSQTKHEVSGLLKGRGQSQAWGPALAFTSSYADSENRKILSENGARCLPRNALSIKAGS